jgi:hypothetical protein
MIQTIKIREILFSHDPVAWGWTREVHGLYAQPSGHYMYRQFNIQQLYILPTQCICVFCVDLRKNSDYFPIQH